MTRQNAPDDDNSTLVQERWSGIPYCALGEVPDDLPEKYPLLYRWIIAKRAIIAAYEEEIPQQCVTDLLTDLRHLCDALRLDFAQCDRTAYRNYACERVAASHGRKIR